MTVSKIRWLVALFALAGIPTAGIAQKQCKKGIPCGGTCISASKTCHVATAASTPTPGRGSTTAEAKPVAAATAAPSSNATGSWVASSRGHTYYKSGCSGAAKLAKSNLIYFKSEADAKAAGYSHSVQKGC